jgi:hypothetical protein
MNVCVIDCSLPPGHPDQVQVRPLTDAERAQRDRDVADGEQARRAQGFLDLRATRDTLLRLTDHLDRERRWQTWRQKLRDLPANTANPEAASWPKPPAAVSCLTAYRGLWPRLDWTPLTKGHS